MRDSVSVFADDSARRRVSVRIRSYQRCDSPLRYQAGHEVVPPSHINQAQFSSHAAAEYNELPSPYPLPVHAYIGTSCDVVHNITLEDAAYARTARFQAHDLYAPRGLQHVIDKRHINVPSKGVSVRSALYETTRATVWDVETAQAYGLRYLNMRYE